MGSNPTDFSRGEETKNGTRWVLLSFDNMGYKGREIAEYLMRNPATITRYSKERERLESEIGRVYEAMRKTEKVNKQVPKL
jgi:predicted transcriptional regulator